MRKQHPGYRGEKRKIEQEIGENEFLEKKHKVDHAKLQDRAVQLLLEKNQGKDRTEVKISAAERNWTTPPSKSVLKNSIRMLREVYLDPKSKHSWTVVYLIYKRSFMGLPFLPTGISEELDKGLQNLAECAKWFLIPTGSPPQHLTEAKLREFQKPAADLPKKYADRLVPYEWLSRELFCLGASKRVDERFGSDGGRKALFATVEKQWTDAVKLRNGILNDLYNVVMHCCDDKGQFKPEYVPNNEDSDDDEENDEEKEEEKEEKKEKEPAASVLDEILENMEENEKQEEADKEKERQALGKYNKCTFCGKTAVWEGCCTSCQMIPANELMKDWTPEMKRIWQKLRAMDEN